MGKDCGRGNERLDAKALAVYHVAEGERGWVVNLSGLTGLRISFEMPRIYENRSLNKETLHVVIHEKKEKFFTRKRKNFDSCALLSLCLRCTGVVTEYRA